MTGKMPVLLRKWYHIGQTQHLDGGLIQKRFQIILISLVIPNTPPKASRPTMTRGVSKLIQNATREYLGWPFFITIPSESYV